MSHGSELIAGLLERFWDVLYAAVIAAFIVAIFVVVFFAAGPLAIVIVGIVCIVMGSYRGSRQRALLVMLCNSVQRQIPFQCSLEAFGREHGPRYRHRIRRLNHLLASGTSLVDALQSLPGLVPGECLPLLRAGERTNRLGEALQRVVRRDSRVERLWAWISGRLYYLGLVILFLIAIGTFIAIKIAPAFAKIFEDFGMRLPGTTRAAISFAGVLLDYGAIPLVIVGVVILLYLYGISRHAQIVRWVLPGAAWVTRRLDTAIVLDALALVAEARQPLTDGLSSLAVSYPRGSMGRRLWRLWGDVAGGCEWSAALRARLGVSRGEAALLESAARSGNLSWALREVAQCNRWRFFRRVQTALQLLFPVALLGLGLLIGFYVVAFFLPMIHLIHSLA